VTLPELIEALRRAADASDRARVTPGDLAGALTEIDRRLRVIEPCPKRVTVIDGKSFSLDEAPHVWDRDDGSECQCCQVRR
jgi:hypothetical protein